MQASAMAAASYHSIASPQSAPVQRRAMTVAAKQSGAYTPCKTSVTHMGTHSVTGA